MSFQDEYREWMAKLLDEIREDPFFRADNFRDEPWYDDFQTFLAIGVCKPAPEHLLVVRKALKIMGCPTHVAGQRQDHILPGEARPEKAKPHRELER